MLECSKCGFNNELGRIFCHQCGAKLDVDKIKPPTPGAKMRRRAVAGARKTVRVVIELGIAIGLIAIIILICLVPEVPPVKPTNAEMVAADTKRLDLQQLVHGTKPGSLEVTDGELNAFLNTIGMDKPKGSGLTLVPVTIRAEFTNGAVKLGYVGELQLGTAVHKQLYLGLAGRLSIEGGEAKFRPTGAWLGRLPIHPKLVEWTGLFQNYFSGLFRKQDAEKQALDKLSSIALTDGHAVLTYQPSASK
jgi:hypothetical protein